jgi:hypothetical protein
MLFSFQKTGVRNLKVKIAKQSAQTTSVPVDAGVHRFRDRTRQPNVQDFRKYLQDPSRNPRNFSKLSGASAEECEKWWATMAIAHGFFQKYQHTPPTRRRRNKSSCKNKSTRNNSSCCKKNALPCDPGV